MNMLTLSLSTNSTIFHIQSAETPYIRGRVDFFFVPGTIIPSVVGNDMQNDPEIEFIPNENAIRFHSWTKARNLLDHLIQQGYINQDERPSVVPISRLIDRNIDLHSKQRDTMLQAQREMLLMVADPYIEAIVENIEDVDVIVTLLRAVTHDIRYSEYDDFISSYRYQSRENINGSLDALRKICLGEAGLETASYLRINDTIPTLHIQRQAIAEACIKKLIEIKALPDHVLFYAAFILIFLNMGDSSAVPLSANLKEYFEKFFKNDEVISNGNGKPFDITLKINMAYHTLLRMGLNPVEQPSLDRIQAIQKTIKSPVLGGCLQSIDNRNSNREWKEFVGTSSMLKAVLPYHAQQGYLPPGAGRWYIYPHCNSYVPLMSVCMLDSTMYGYFRTCASNYITNNNLNVSNAKMVMADTAYLLISGLMSYYLCSDDNENILPKALIPAGVQLLGHSFNSSVSNLSPFNKYFSACLFDIAGTVVKSFYQGIPQTIVTSIIATFGQGVGVNLAKRIPISKKHEQTSRVSGNSSMIFNQHASSLYNKALSLDKAGKALDAYETFKKLSTHCRSIFDKNDNPESRGRLIKAYNNVGIAAQKLNKHDEAIYYTQLAIDFSPVVNSGYLQRLEECKARQSLDSAYRTAAP